MVEEEYQKIINSGMTGNNLITSLNDFELRHPEHLASKIDLASYYALMKNYDKALEYLIRGESIVNKIIKQKDSKEIIVKLYGLFANIYLLNNNLSLSESYVEKAINFDKELGKEFKYLNASIKYAKGNKEEALVLFDQIYKIIPDEINNEELKTYVYLLNENERYEDARNLLEIFFNRKIYFPGLGLFASAIYESQLEVDKAIYCAFIDYEYYSGYQNIGKHDFLDNLDELEKKLIESNSLEKGNNALMLIRLSLYEKPLVDIHNVSSFLIEKYLYLKIKIISKNFSITDFKEYLSLEPFFNDFPVYYWTAWLAVNESSLENRKNYSILLEKIITLSSTGVYSGLARAELGKLLGLSEVESEKILLQNEVVRIITSYLDTLDKMLLIPICDFLELPDNVYIYQTIEILKNGITDIRLSNAIQSILINAKGRLKERLQFVLY